MSNVTDGPPLVGPIAAVRVFVRDLVRARVFYRERLGLSELSVTASWAVFDAGGVQLIAEIASPVEDPDEPLDDGESLVGRFTGFSFSVDDADTACAALKRRASPSSPVPSVRPGAAPWSRWLTPTATS